MVSPARQSTAVSDLSVEDRELARALALLLVADLRRAPQNSNSKPALLRGPDFAVSSATEPRH